MISIKILDGYLKDRKIISNSFVRPTSSKVKKSIFTTLPSQMNGINVLDLFAGTGALGIETLSRGAKKVFFIDYKKKNIKDIQDSLKKLNILEKSILIRWNVLISLNCLKKLGITFEVIFIDPPYNQKLVSPSLINLYEANVFNKKTCIIVEHSKKENIVRKLPSQMILKNQKKYGDSCVSFIYPVS